MDANTLGLKSAKALLMRIKSSLDILYHTLSICIAIPHYILNTYFCRT